MHQIPTTRGFGLYEWNLTAREAVSSAACVQIEPVNWTCQKNEAEGCKSHLYWLEDETIIAATAVLHLVYLQLLSGRHANSTRSPRQMESNRLHMQQRDQAEFFKDTSCPSKVLLCQFIKLRR